MKQVLLITAYKEFDYLEALCRMASQMGFYSYVHIDLKTANDKILDTLNGLERVVAISKFRIPWGGYTHVLAVIELMKLALSNDTNFDYMHIITGQDAITKSMSEFNEFFSSDNEMNYMSCSNSHNMDFRYRVYYRNDLINYKSKIGNILTKCLYSIQRILLIRRKVPFGWELYKGMLYVSITEEFAKYVLDFIETSEGLCFLSWLKWCFIPEEFFFQSILMNSLYKKTLDHDNYRYALWEKKNGSQPGVLDNDDYEAIRKSNSFFARKMSSDYSSELITRLKNDIL